MSSPQILAYILPTTNSVNQTHTHTRTTYTPTHQPTNQTDSTKGHVRSCGFGQERHFKLDNCFDCEVHYIRNEVNRLQIKMRRAMKEDKTLSEEQRKTAREAITRDEVEKGK